MYKVFDIHTHTYPEAIAEKACVNLGKFYDFIVEGEGTYAHLESQAEEKLEVWLRPLAFQGEPLKL